VRLPDLARDTIPAIRPNPMSTMRMTSEPALLRTPSSPPWRFIEPPYKSRNAYAASNGPTIKSASPAAKRSRLIIAIQAAAMAKLAFVRSCQAS